MALLNVHNIVSDTDCEIQSSVLRFVIKNADNNFQNNREPANIRESYQVKVSRNCCLIMLDFFQTSIKITNF